MNYLKDWIVYILVRCLIVFFKALPVSLGLLLGRFAGRILYYLDKRHRKNAYLNLRIAFSGTKTVCELKKILKASFINLAQNVIETFRLSLIDKDYIEKYIDFENRDCIKEALKQNKGVILVGSHFGSWEMSNLIVKLLGYDYYVYAKEQKKFSLAYAYLNKLIASKGTNILDKDSAVFKIARALKCNKVVGMVADHGGKTGLAVPFFGKLAPTPTGAIRMALKFGCPVVIGLIRRDHGPYHKVNFLLFEVVNSKDAENDLKENLSRMNKIIESYVAKYPENNLWYYKRWKYSPQKNVLVLSDGKAGHLNQSKAVLKILNNTDFVIKSDIVEVKFKNNFTKKLLVFCAMFNARNCQGCLSCLKFCLDRESFNKLISMQADIIISSGSALAPVSVFLKKEMSAKNICVMNPGVLTKKVFDLVISPRHDKLKPDRNIVLTHGALNLVDDDYLSWAKDKFKAMIYSDNSPKKANLTIGFLVGGNTKGFILSQGALVKVVEEIKKIIKESSADLLATTSRRTSAEQENIVKSSLLGLARFLVIANEKNFEDSVGAILGFSDIIVVSGESISMVSEAATSGKHVVVFNLESKSKDNKHSLFLNDLARNGFIYLVEPRDIYNVISRIVKENPPVNRLVDVARIQEVLEKIL